MPRMRMHSGLLPREPWPPRSSGHSFTELLSRVRDVWPFVQLFVDNVSSTELTLNEFGGCTRRQLPAVRYRRAVTERPMRPSVSQRPTMTVRSPTTTVQHNDVAVQKRHAVPNAVAVQNKGAAAQPVVDTVAEPLNLPAGSSRRQSKPLTPPRIIPLRFTVLRLLFRYWWLLYFTLCSYPFCRYSFSLLCPSPPSFSPYLKLAS